MKCDTATRQRRERSERRAKFGRVGQNRARQGGLSKQPARSAKFICRRASQAGTWSTSVRQDEGSGAPGMLNRQGVVSGGDVL